MRVKLGTALCAACCLWFGDTAVAGTRPTDNSGANVTVCAETAPDSTALPEIAPGSVRLDSGGTLGFDIAGGTNRTLAVERKVGDGRWEAVAMMLPSRFGGRFQDVPSGTSPVLYRLADRATSALMVQEFGCEPDSERGSIPSPPVGEPWTLRSTGWGNSSMARIRDGAVVDENPSRTVTYLGQRLARMPRRVEMIGEWRKHATNGTVDAFFTVALCAPSDTAPWYLRCVHIRFHRESVAVDVSHNGPLSLNRDVAPTSLSLGTPHHFVIETESDLLTIWIDGTQVLRSARPEYGESAGRYVFWEIYANHGTMRTTVAIRSVGAYAPDGR